MGLPNKATQKRHYLVLSFLCMKNSIIRTSIRVAVTLLFVTAISFVFNAESKAASNDVYERIKTLEFSGRTVNVTDLVLVRDRVEMRFTGTISFAAPVDGVVTAAVFSGEGRIKAEIPPSPFEKDNLKFLTGEDEFNTNFKSAVLRFYDDSYEILGANAQDGAPSESARKEALDHEEQTMKESGFSMSSRIALSMLNKDKKGLFLGTFDGGKMGRFSFVFDPQTRIPATAFGINAGENGIIYSYDRGISGNDVWLAFYELDNYKTGFVAYSNAYDLIDVTHYDLKLDLREPKSALRLRSDITFKAMLDGVRAIPFYIGESLGEYRNQRLKKQLRVQSVNLGDTEIPFSQEDWESGFTIYLPESQPANKELKVTIILEGDYLRQEGSGTQVHYPRSNSTWYPRHGYLDRSTFNFEYLHHKKLKMASVGTRTSEGPAVEDKDAFLTTYQMKQPVALATFAMGPFERHTAQVKWDDGSEPIELEFNSLPGGLLRLKEDFVLAELDNSIRYFYALFGEYPYGRFSATYHPYGFGQGFASMLMIPKTDNANKYTYAFIAHETSHQWWGNIVAWRSYRDQWLSEGFAEYSGVLYSRLRDSPKAADNLLKNMQKALKDKPRNTLGLGKGRDIDLGSLVQGYRLDSSKSIGSYSNVIYNKGGLVLRMLHFLFTDPSTGDDKAFFNMMKDFVAEYKNKEASTDDFRLVANKHFVNTSIAKKYRLNDLNWFFNQWVYRTNLPSLDVTYSYTDNSDGSVIFEGEINQKDVDANWFMPIPFTFRFGKDEMAIITLPAVGEKTPFRVKLPKRPSATEVDSMRWLLLDDISEKEQKK